MARLRTDGGSLEGESLQRDISADRRDREADQRDRDADQRDQEADRAEAANTDTTVSSDDGHRAARESAASDRRAAFQDRGAAAQERTAAMRDRLASLLDREASAGDRRLSGVDRAESAEDRSVYAETLEVAALDALTGAYLRGAGMRELERDLSRTRRAGQSFTVAFVDVDKLKEVNDREGHLAGDRLLRTVVARLRQTLRSYDLVVRYGGDEFVCGMSGVTMADATARLALVNDALDVRRGGYGSVTCGLAEYEDGESVERLVARADAALYDERRRRAVAG